MQSVPAGVPLSFEVTFDSPGLFVAMSVFDNSTGSAVLVQGPLAMTNFFGNSYSGQFTGADGHQYLIVKAVYTDGSFTVFNDTYLQGSEAIRCDNPQVPTNQPLPNFEFPMTDSTFHNPMLGLMPITQVSIDGAVPADTVNVAIEIGQGLYAIDLEAADLNGKVITLILSAPNADTRFITFITEV